MRITYPHSQSGSLHLKHPKSKASNWPLLSKQFSICILIPDVIYIPLKIEYNIHNMQHEIGNRNMHRLKMLITQGRKPAIKNILNSPGKKERFSTTTTAILLLNSRGAVVVSPSTSPLRRSSAPGTRLANFRSSKIWLNRAFQGAPTRPFFLKIFKRRIPTPDLSLTKNPPFHYTS